MIKKWKTQVTAISISIVAFGCGSTVSTDSSGTLRELDYLQEIVDPCVSVADSHIDPCEVRIIPQMPTTAFLADYNEIPAYWKLYYDVNGTPSLFTPHLAARATFLPNTTRCDVYQHRLPAFRIHQLSDIEHLVVCFVDVRVNEYLIGKGPSKLDVAAHTFPFLYIEGDDLEWIDRHRAIVARSYEGSEGVLMLGPVPTTVLEAWWMIEYWDVQAKGGQTVVIAPFKEAIEQSAIYEISTEDRALLEVPLIRFESIMNTGALARTTETKGRIGVGDNLPMLITDANFLRPYYEGPGVGIVYETDAPAKPPPVPGVEDPQHPPGRVNEEETDDQPTVTMPGEEEPLRPRDNDTTTTSSP